MMTLQTAKKLFSIHTIGALFFFLSFWECVFWSSFTVLVLLIFIEDPFFALDRKVPAVLEKPIFSKKPTVLPLKILVFLLEHIRILLFLKLRAIYLILALYFALSMHIFLGWMIGTLAPDGKEKWAPFVAIITSRTILLNIRNCTDDLIHELQNAPDAVMKYGAICNYMRHLLVGLGNTFATWYRRVL